MFTHIALLGLALMPATPVPHSRTYRPRIELWTNRGDGAVYTRGDRVRLYFKLDRDAFVTIFRVDTDGRVRVLFPREPWEDNFARGGREFEVDGRSLHNDAFTIDDYPGVGYLFAVVSADPFVYDGIESGDHWDYRVIADGRVRGDPYVALTDLAQRIVPQDYADWDYDIVSYNVGQHYDYPRFLCYDCHTYASYPYWDPYHYSCVRFRMFVYDDPWYYPYRYYGGRRVVFVRPYRPQPRYIFKDWGVSRPSREGFVTRERERPANDNTRRGVTGRDIGTQGVIPPPNVRTRRDQPGQGQPQQPGDDRGNKGNDDRGNRGNDDRGNRGNDDRGNRGNDDRGKPNRPDPSDPQRPMVLPQRDEPRAEPRREEPRQVEPRRVEPRRVEPRDEPRRIEPRAEPRREEPRRVEPRAEPRREEPRRVEPRREEPRRAEPRPAPAPAPAPRAEPRNDPPREKPSNEPEVRRRVP
jgi:hypothetical protein